MVGVHFIQLPSHGECRVGGSWKDTRCDSQCGDRTVSRDCSASGYNLAPGPQILVLSPVIILSPQQPGPLRHVLCSRSVRSSGINQKKDSFQEKKKCKKKKKKKRKDKKCPPKSQYTTFSPLKCRAQDREVPEHKGFPPSVNHTQAIFENEQAAQEAQCECDLQQHSSGKFQCPVQYTYIYGTFDSVTYNLY